MKLPLSTLVRFLFSPPRRPIPLAVTVELCLQPQKNQPLWAGFLYLKFNFSRPTLFFFLQPLFPPTAAHCSRLFKLQVASNPA